MAPFSIFKIQLLNTLGDLNSSILQFAHFHTLSGKESLLIVFLKKTLLETLSTLRLNFLLAMIVNGGTFAESTEKILNFDVF